MAGASSACGIIGEARGDRADPDDAGAEYRVREPAAGQQVTVKVRRANGSTALVTGTPGNLK